MTWNEYSYRKTYLIFVLKNKAIETDQNLFFFGKIQQC